MGYSGSTNLVGIELQLIVYESHNNYKIKSKQIFGFIIIILQGRMTGILFKMCLKGAGEAELMPTFNSSLSH